MKKHWNRNRDKNIVIELLVRTFLIIEAPLNLKSIALGVLMLLALIITFLIVTINSFRMVSIGSGLEWYFSNAPSWDCL